MIYKFQISQHHNDREILFSKIRGRYYSKERERYHDGLQKKINGSLQFLEGTLGLAKEIRNEVSNSETIDKKALLDKSDEMIRVTTVQLSIWKEELKVEVSLREIEELLRVKDVEYECHHY